jgi:hypothetical protein
MIDNEENVLNHNECSYCLTDFNKNNKPLVMKCSHNICQTCRNLNTHLKCLICKIDFDEKDTKRLPINFLLLDILEAEWKKMGDNSKKKKKSSKSNEKLLNSIESVQCLDCNLMFSNKNHFNFYNSHKQVEVELSKEEHSDLNEKSTSLIQNYKKYNSNLDALNEGFFIYLNECLCANRENLKKSLESNSSLDNLVLLGFLSQIDKERICEFQDNYLKNKQLQSLIKESQNFDDLITNLSKLKDFKINNFMSSYFFYEEIKEKKLKPEIMKEKLEMLNENLLLKEDSDLNKIMSLFIQDLKVIVYNSLSLDRDINKSLKISIILIPKIDGYDIITFDPLSEKIKYFQDIQNYFPEKLRKLRNFSFILNKNYDLYITGGRLQSENKIITIKNCFSINLNSKNVVMLSDMIEERHSHCSLIVDQYLFVTGGKSEENNIKTGEKFNISSNQWIKIHGCPIETEETSKILCHDDEDIYLFNDLKTFCYYEIKNDKWTLCKPTYKGSYSLELANFTLYGQDANIIILGGLNKNRTHINNDIFYLKQDDCVFGSKGQFSLSDLSSNIDYGYILDSHYLLEYSQDKKEARVFFTKELAKHLWKEIIVQEIK